MLFNTILISFGHKATKISLLMVLDLHPQSKMVM